MAARTTSQPASQPAPPPADQPRASLGAHQGATNEPAAVAPPRPGLVHGRARQAPVSILADMISGRPVPRLSALVWRRAQCASLLYVFVRLLVVALGYVNKAALK